MHCTSSWKHFCEWCEKFYNFNDSKNSLNYQNDPKGWNNGTELISAKLGI